jgi:hypothetical protein
MQKKMSIPTLCVRVHRLDYDEYQKYLATDKIKAHKNGAGFSVESLTPTQKAQGVSHRREGAKRRGGIRRGKVEKRKNRV